MELDDLKAVWQKEVDMTAQMVNFEQIQKDVDKLDRSSRWSWLREGLGAIVMIIVTVIYVWGIVDNASAFLQLSALLFISPLAYAVNRFYQSQQTTTEDDWSVLSKVNRQIEKRQKEVKMLGSLAVWHLIPVFITAVLFSYAVFSELTGESQPNTELLLWWVGGLAYFIFLHYLNRWTLNKNFRPALEKLQEIKKALERE